MYSMSLCWGLILSVNIQTTCLMFVICTLLNSSALKVVLRVPALPIMAEWWHIYAHHKYVITSSSVAGCFINPYSASHDNLCTVTLWNRIMTATMRGDCSKYESARYKPALLNPCLEHTVLEATVTDYRVALSPADGPGSVSLKCWHFV